MRISIFLALCLLCLIVLSGIVIPDNLYEANFLLKNLPPMPSHPFGTDFLGRDMFFRTLSGLSTSTMLGFISAIISTTIAIILGLASGYIGGFIDKVINWLIDLSFSIPHLVQLMLIAFMCGGGFSGVIIAISVTHWGALTRLIRAEVLQLKNMTYISISRSFSRTHRWILMRHILPQIFPQIVTGFVIIFPHAILHESAITFIGFGLSRDVPAIGTILSESMKYLVTGSWWLAFFPGFSLLLIVLMFYKISAGLTNPRR